MKPPHPPSTEIAVAGNSALQVGAALTRRQFVQLLGGGTILLFSGCANPWFKKKSKKPDTPELPGDAKVVGDFCLPFGLFPIRVEAVSLLTGLASTGSNPPPSAFRDQLLQELRVHRVPEPEQVLASNTTALVLVRGFLRPGIRKGETFDLEIRVPSDAETASLRGGHLIQCRLAQMEVVDRLRQGDVLGSGEGAVLVDPALANTEENRTKLCRGVVLGGGTVLKDRGMGLVLKEEHQSVSKSQLVGDAVNRRFYQFQQGIQEGVADPQNDQYIELAVHSRYKDNVDRYMQVVRAVALKETAKQRSDRLERLKKQLLEPITSSAAAIRLEAIGKDAIDTLKAGLESDDAEVRFYAAESLAYLDDVAAVPALAEAAKNEPAFRVYALTALSAMDEINAEEALRSLLNVTSAETRYGAFRSLWAMNPNNPLIRGEDLKGRFSYHVLDLPEPAMVHVARSRRAEIVLFGKDQQFKTPMILDAGQHVFVDGRQPGSITVSRMDVGKPLQRRVVSERVDEVIRAMAELDATYPDIVHALQQAKENGSLTSRLEFDALPQGGRQYDREDGDESPRYEVDNPLPGLFAKRDGKSDEDKPKKKNKSDRDAETPAAGTSPAGETGSAADKPTTSETAATAKKPEEDKPASGRMWPWRR